MTAEREQTGREATCSDCGALFACAALSGEATCWCMSLPPLAPQPGKGCYCSRCLESRLRAAKPGGGGA